VGNDYLEGDYAPVRREQTITQLAVTGTIPTHLDGRYLRNGPNPIAEVDPEIYHWFAGDGMVHGVRLRDGNAEWYRNRCNRWIRTPAVARALGEPAGEFVFVPNRAAGTSPAPEDDGVLMGFVYDASTDRSDLTILDAASLETIASIHLPDRVPHGFHGNWVPAPAK
jgi:carotenoid cleavage dioxygenase-like enzyme